jgi:hypothetical protein
VVTSTGSFPVTAKNAFKSKATVPSVFGRHRPATNSKYRAQVDRDIGAEPESTAGGIDPRQY